MIPPVPESLVSHATQRNDRLVALFLLGIVLFTPPLLRVFGGAATLGGWPVLFIYIFLVWGVVVALIAVDVESRDDERKRRPNKSAPTVPADQPSR